MTSIHVVQNLLGLESKLIDELSIPKLGIWPFKYSVVPPWKYSAVQFCRYFSGTKNDVSDDMMRASFLEHVLDHEDAILIFTDGSKSDAGVGFGVVFPNFNQVVGCQTKHLFLRLNAMQF